MTSIAGAPQSMGVRQRWRRHEREPPPPSADGVADVKVADLVPSARIAAVPKETENIDVPSPPPDQSVRHRPRDPCPICMDGFELDKSVMPRQCRLCGNHFHQSCLAEWGRKEQQMKWEQKPWMLPSQFESGSCPCCRSSQGHDRSRRWRK